jgi:microcystin degradation protein MlrC
MDDRCFSLSLENDMKKLLSLFTFGVALGLLSCQAGESRGEDREFRVAVAMFSHETCTFCPGGDVEVEDWLRVSPPLAGEALLGSGGYVRGFVEMAHDYGDMELVGLTSPVGVFGGSSRSWNTEETFNHFLDLMIQDLEAAMPVDGVYLSLHGAMAVRDVPRPEAEIARRFREVVGPDVPIAGSFDLHGNEDEEFLEHADFAFTTKRYPHYDAALQGERAAKALHLTMSGDYSPTTATRRPGIITATVLQWTGTSPSMDIMERARRWEARQADAFVSVFYGYPWSDVPDVGATIHVMTNGDQELADRIADDMNEFFWRVREEFAVGSYPLPDEAARMVQRAIAEDAIPVAVGDHSDRPGDATHILRAFEAADVNRVLYGAITSPQTLDALREQAAGPGDAFDMEIGGFTPSGGSPFRIQGTLTFFDAAMGYEAVAVVEFGEGNVVILAPTYTQVTDPNRFRFGPIQLSDFDVFVVKSRVHFRRGFDETGFAKTIIVVEAPGPFVGTTFLDALPYEHVDLSVLYPFGMPTERR